jgi:hypothetical protein
MPTIRIKDGIDLAAFARRMNRSEGMFTGGVPKRPFGFRTESAPGSSERFQFFGWDPARPEGDETVIMTGKLDSSTRWNGKGPTIVLDTKPTIDAINSAMREFAAAAKKAARAARVTGKIRPTVQPLSFVEAEFSVIGGA